MQDGLFWHLLTYCAGVGGSLLIIGSAAGVVAMGLEKINFGWYFKKITLLAFAGYASGILVILQMCIRDSLRGLPPGAFLNGAGRWPVVQFLSLFAAGIPEIHAVRNKTACVIPYFSNKVCIFAWAYLIASND